VRAREEELAHGALVVGTRAVTVTLADDADVTAASLLSAVDSRAASTMDAHAAVAHFHQLRLRRVRGCEQCCCRVALRV
jgi:hypothetical protein